MQWLDSNTVFLSDYIVVQRCPYKIFDALLESVSNSTSKESGRCVGTLQWSLYGEQLTPRFVKTPSLGMHTSGYIQSTDVLH